MHVYYAFFGLILVFSFLVLPLNFFFHATSPLADEVDEDGEEAAPETCGKKMFRAFKYTSASLVLLALLILLGIFLPFEGSPPPVDSVDEKIVYLWNQMKANEGKDLVVFLINTVSVIGMFLVIIYTAYGMSAWPFSLIGGAPTVHSELSSVDSQITANEEQIEALRNNEQEGGLNTFEQGQRVRLENELRMLQRTRHNLDQASRSITNRCLLVFRPFQMVAGLLFCGLGFLIFISLLLSSIDKALHSGGAHKGYVLKNGTLPNPLDLTLVYAQDVFPLDYVIYTSLILFFVFSSMSGVKAVGIRLLWLPLYKIRPYATRPQALSLMALNLILILLALNVVLFNLVPDYTTYGSQYFIVEKANTTVIEHCDTSHAPAHQCVMTRVAVLLLAFHTKVWIFGAAYYWLTWFFLLSVFGGAFIAMYQTHRGRTRMREEEDEDSLLDDETT